MNAGIYRILLDGHALYGCDEGLLLASLVKLVQLLKTRARRSPRFEVELFDSRLSDVGYQRVQNAVTSKLKAGEREFKWLLLTVVRSASCSHAIRLFGEPTSSRIVCQWPA